MRHTPCRAAQVSGDRTLTRSIPSAPMRSIATSSISSLRATIASPLFSSTRSRAAMRPTRRSTNGSGIWVDSSRVIQVPRSVPQSSSRVMTSCATSTRRRVRYPESAVRRAVSASPLRAPWLEMKYSSTLIPSRRLLRIGRSMIRPDGSAIRPRMPASWCTCVTFPRAPEWVIIQAEALDAVDELGGRDRAQLAVALRDERLEPLAVHHPVDEAELLGDDRVEDHASCGRLDQLGIHRTCAVVGGRVPHLELDLDRRL